MSDTPRVDAVAPVDAFLTDSDHWAVSKTDYDCLLDVARQLEGELAKVNAKYSALGNAHGLRLLGLHELIADVYTVFDTVRGCPFTDAEQANFESVYRRVEEVVGLPGTVERRFGRRA